MDNIAKIAQIAWRVIELLVQAILILTLLAILIGDQAGSVANSVYLNVSVFLAGLPPSSIAVAVLIAVLIWWNKKAVT
ncbi:MAG: hypothetical protein Q8P46_06235 [Hyphomicrobiales bacterium]|jgi:hypothetical protein|nr:hypothetical protein [Hyphomicrobiales bacterium]